MDTGVASHEILYDNGATMSHTMLWRHRSRCGRLHRRYCRWRRCNVISILSLFFHYIFVVYEVASHEISYGSYKFNIKK